MKNLQQKFEDLIELLIGRYPELEFTLRRYLEDKIDEQDAGHDEAGK